MLVIFVRHGAAEDAAAGGDRARALTVAGCEQVRDVAGAIRNMEGKLAHVLTSPLARALQTAEILALVHGGAKVETADFLTPPASAAALRSRLAQLHAASVKSVAVVGHAPSLDECLGLLVASQPRIGISLTKAGAACVELPADWPDAAPQLQWLMRRDQLVERA